MDYRYNTRLYGLLRDFGVRFSDIEKLHRQIIAAERLCVRPQGWKQLWAKFWRRFTSDCDRILMFMSKLSEIEVIDMTSKALGGTLASHRRFKERHQLDVAAKMTSMHVQQSSNKAAAAAMPQQILTPQLNVQTTVDKSRDVLPLVASAKDSSGKLVAAVRTSHSGVGLTQQALEKENPPHTYDAEAVIGNTLSSLKQTSVDCHVRDFESSRQGLSKLQANNAIFRSILRGTQSQSEPSGSHAHVRNSIEMEEVVIDKGGTDIGAGVGQMQSQQRIATGCQVVQRDTDAVNPDGAVLETAPRAAVVRKKIVAALAVSSRGRVGSHLLSAAFSRPIEARRHEGFEKELSPARSEVALRVGSAALQSSSPLALSTLSASPLEVYEVASQIHVPRLPPRSRSRSRGAVAIAADPLACGISVPPPPPRSRSVSRSGISAATAGSESFCNADGVENSSRQINVTKLQANKAIFRSILRNQQSRLKLSPPDDVVLQQMVAAEHQQQSSNHHPDSIENRNGSFKRTGQLSSQAVSGHLNFHGSIMQSAVDHVTEFTTLERDGVDFAEC